MTMSSSRRQLPRDTRLGPSRHGYHPFSPYTGLFLPYFDKCSKERYLCSGCRFEHPKSFFHPLEIEVSAYQRVCMASQRSLYISESVSMDFKDLKAVLSEAKMRTGKELVVFENGQVFQGSKDWEIQYNLEAMPGVTIIYNHSEWARECGMDLPNGYADDYRIHYSQILGHRKAYRFGREPWVYDALLHWHGVVCPHHNLSGGTGPAVDRLYDSAMMDDRIGVMPQGPELNQTPSSYFVCQWHGCDTRYAVRRGNPTITSTNPYWQEHYVYIEIERRLGHLFDANEPGWISQTTPTRGSGWKFSVATEAGRAILKATRPDHQEQKLAQASNTSYGTDWESPGR